MFVDDCDIFLPDNKKAEGILIISGIIIVERQESHLIITI